MGRLAYQSDDTSYFRLRLMLAPFLILFTVGFSAMMDARKGHSEKTGVLVPFHLISQSVKLGTFPLFLQSFNSVKEQYGLCHHHSLPSSLTFSLEKKAARWEQPGVKDREKLDK